MWLRWMACRWGRAFQLGDSMMEGAEAGKQYATLTGQPGFRGCFQ